MTLAQLIHGFAPLDMVAGGFLLASWIIFGWLVERTTARRPSVTVLMAQYRRDWMTLFVTRENRIFDANILGTLRQSTNFFASASMIALGGALALLGNTQPLLGLAQEFALAQEPTVVWDMKLLLIVLLLANAFLKFVWSQRLFGYCAVVLASVPADSADPLARTRAAKAAEINISAGRSFNRGLRSVYFTLAALAWLLGPWPLMLATLGTLLLLWRREFGSNSRRVLLADD